MLWDKTGLLLEHIIRAENNDPVRMAAYKSLIWLLLLIMAKKGGRPKTAMVFQTNKVVHEKQIANEGSYDSSQNQNSALHTKAFTKVGRPVFANNNY